MGSSALKKFSYPNPDICKREAKVGMTKKAKIIVTIALMLGMFLAALDTTIVGTALPSIVGKLGGISLYSWVFSTYLLTSTTSTVSQK